MQALFALFRVVFGMRAMFEEDGIQTDTDSGSTDVYAAEGPLNPPKP